jgi:hypothetical protein
MKRSVSITVSLVALMTPGAALTQAASQPARDSGDSRRVRWIRPYADAIASAVALHRPLLVKPILGGSNTPDPKGVPCGGKHDCEGSW